MACTHVHIALIFRKTNCKSIVKKHLAFMQYLDKECSKIADFKKSGWEGGGGGGGRVAKRGRGNTLNKRATLKFQSKADAAARTRCFSPPPSHHLSLTVCLAAWEKLHSNGRSTATMPRSIRSDCSLSIIDNSSERCFSLRNKNVSHIDATTICCTTEFPIRQERLR
jgi:hypothetical protein